MSKAAWLVMAMVLVGFTFNLSAREKKEKGGAAPAGQTLKGKVKVDGEKVILTVTSGADSKDWTLKGDEAILTQLKGLKDQETSVTGTGTESEFTVTKVGENGGAHGGGGGKKGGKKH